MFAFSHLLNISYSLTLATQFITSTSLFSTLLHCVPNPQLKNSNLLPFCFSVPSFQLHVGVQSKHSIGLFFRFGGNIFKRPKIVFFRLSASLAMVSTFRLHLISSVIIHTNPYLYFFVLFLDVGRYRLCIYHRAFCPLNSEFKCFKTYNDKQEKCIIKSVFAISIIYKVAR